MCSRGVGGPLSPAGPGETAAGPIVLACLSRRDRCSESKPTDVRVPLWGRPVGRDSYDPLVGRCLYERPGGTSAAGTPPCLCRPGRRGRRSGDGWACAPVSKTAPGARTSARRMADRQPPVSMGLIRLPMNRFGNIEVSFVNARILRRVLRCCAPSSTTAAPKSRPPTSSTMRTSRPCSKACRDGRVATCGAAGT